MQEVMSLTRNSRHELEWPQYAERSQRFDVEYLTVGDVRKTNAKCSARYNTQRVLDETLHRSIL